MLGTVMGTQLPVVLQVVVPQQPAQDVEELLKADLVVLVLVSGPEQLGNEVWLLPALQWAERQPLPRCLGLQMARLPTARLLEGNGTGTVCGPACRGGLQKAAPYSVARTPCAAESARRGRGLLGNSTWGRRTVQTGHHSLAEGLQGLRAWP